MEEFNFKLTKEEADRIVQSLSVMNNNLISKMQEQFMVQTSKPKEDEILLEEKDNEENSKDN